MADIYVLAEHRQGVLRDVTFEALGLARTLAPLWGGRVVAVVIGKDVGAFATRLARSAHRVLRVEEPRLDAFNAEGYQAILARLVADGKPALTLIPHTGFGVDLAPSLAVQLDLPLVTDCVGVTLRDGRVVATRQVFSGKLLAEVAFKEAGPGIATLRPGSFPAAPADLTGDVVDVASPLTGSLDHRRFLGYVEATVGDVDITQASIIVAAGRGIKEQENIALVESLAQSLGGVLAGSRPVVDAGWLPKDRQVGSSGKTVKPKLYIAVGISGSFQHVMGMKGSETIVAINKDPNAPIFAEAHYGIVGDLFKVVPALVGKIKELRG